MKVAYMNLFGELQYLPNQTFQVAFLANFVLVTTKKTAGLLNLPDINIQTHWLGTVETFFSNHHRDYCPQQMPQTHIVVWKIIMHISESSLNVTAIPSLTGRN